ncbi:MAG: hypothetical protein ACO1SX_08040 [Actinomycetota bacterium]
MVAYLAVTMLMTWPVTPRLATHLAGSGGDGWVYLWNHWWIAHAVMNQDVTLFQTGHLFHPEPIGLFTTTLTIASGLMMLPVQLLAGPLVATNVYFLFSFWLAAHGAYLLLRYLTGDHEGAMVGGLVFAFCPYMTAHALGHFNLIATGWTPLFLLYFIRSLREKGWWAPCCAGLLMVLQLYTEFILGLFAVMLAAGWLLLELIFSRGKIVTRTGLLQLAVMLGIVVAALAPYLVAAQADGGVVELVSKPSWFGAHEHGAPITSFFLPSALHPFWGPKVQPIVGQYFGTTADNTVYLGWSVLFLSGYALWAVRERALKFTAIALAAGFALLSLGPTLRFVRAPILNAIQIDGVNITPGMPFVLLHFVPVLRQLRIPTRFNILTMLMLAILVALAIAHLRQQPWFSRHGWFRRAAPMVLGLLVLLDFLVAPHYTALADVPPVYRRLQTLPKDAAVLDIPFGCLDGTRHYGGIDPRSMYFQTVHERPILGGYISRMPDRAIDQYRAVPFLHEVATRIDPALQPQACSHGDTADADDELERLKVGVVVLDSKRFPQELHNLVRAHLTRGRWESEGGREIYYPKWTISHRR